MLERVGGELVKCEREELHRLVRKRHRRAVDDDALTAGRDGDGGEFSLHKLPERKSAVGQEPLDARKRLEPIVELGTIVRERAGFSKGGVRNRSHDGKKVAGAVLELVDEQL